MAAADPVLLLSLVVSVTVVKNRLRTVLRIVLRTGRSLTVLKLYLRYYVVHTTHPGDTM